MMYVNFWPELASNGMRQWKRLKYFFIFAASKTRKKRLII